MDPFRLCLALGPVAVYLMLIGALNVAKRPFLVSGGRDTAALGLALSGFVIVGPIELFFPATAAVHFGPYVWLLLLALYGLCLGLIVLLLQPRLVIYNVSADQLRPILADVVDQLDAEARWAGETLLLPNLGLQLHLDTTASMRNVALVAINAHQSFDGWRRLEDTLAAALARAETGRNPRGASLLSAGTLIGLALVLAIARAPEAVAEALFEMLHL